MAPSIVEQKTCVLHTLPAVSLSSVTATSV
jgi:hypothetical protein